MAHPAPNPTPVEHYGTWLATAPYAWPDNAVLAAQHSFIDVIGVMVPGAIDDATNRVF